MAKILNKFMEYIGFGKDDVEYDEEPEDSLRLSETVLRFFVLLDIVLADSDIFHEFV